SISIVPCGPCCAMKSSRASAEGARSAGAATVLAWQCGVGAIALVAWQTLVTMKVLDAFFVSRPTDIARRLAQWVAGGTLWAHLATTLEESLLGLVAGAALGISMGFGFARSPMVARVF